MKSGSWSSSGGRLGSGQVVRVLGENVLLNSKKQLNKTEERMDPAREALRRLFSKKKLQEATMKAYE